MPLPISVSFTPTKFFLVFFFILHAHGHGDLTDDNEKIVKIGAIIDANSHHVGREEKVAMKIGIEEFNNASTNNYKLALDVNDSGAGDPQRAASAAGNISIHRSLPSIRCTSLRPLLIGVPGKASFEKFVKVEEDGNPTGFSIDVFREAVRLLDNDLRYVFKVFNVSYDELVEKVISQEIDAVVGDVTILANRSKYVDFTHPYAESGLSMMIPVKLEESQRAWWFVKPFTWETWSMIGAMFVYALFTVWFLERGSNQEFGHRWHIQLSTAFWFTFSTLFFIHTERIRNNLTRIVIAVWFFAIFVLTTSYTASLTSLLTVQRLEPTVTTNIITSLIKNNSTIGYHGASLKEYLIEKFNFSSTNIKEILSEDDYKELFENGNISAAFLELPYLKEILSKYKNEYKDAGLTYRFGGFGFVFPKGCPIARNISEAILKLSEDGTIAKLEKETSKSSSDFSNCHDDMKIASLSHHNFWVLFILTGGTSTVVFLLYLLHVIKGRISKSTSEGSSI